MNVLLTIPLLISCNSYNRIERFVEAPFFCKIDPVADRSKIDDVKFRVYFGYDEKYRDYTTKDNSFINRYNTSYGLTVSISSICPDYTYNLYNKFVSENASNEHKYDLSNKFFKPKKEVYKEDLPISFTFTLNMNKLNNWELNYGQSYFYLYIGEPGIDKKSDKEANLQYLLVHYRIKDTIFTIESMTEFISVVK